MGGAIAFASALRLQDSLRGLVLSAPALAPGEQPPALRVAMARLVAAIAPNVGALKLDANAVSRDHAVVREYTADPLICGSYRRTIVNCSTRWPASAQAPRLPTRPAWRRQAPCVAALPDLPAFGSRPHHAVPTACITRFSTGEREQVCRTCCRGCTVEEIDLT
jgi:pimeloyl-ACP methyl ester carboxylesterase